MLDILICGIPKPTDCGKCFVGDRTICADGCPLVELPEHGDLISKEQAFRMMLDRGYQKEAAGVILEVPPVIPSNKEDSK